MDHTPPTIATITETDLLRLGALDQRVEVLNGELRAMPPVGAEHAEIAGNVYDALKSFVRQHDLGFVWGDSLIYVLERDGEAILRSRIPDASFLRKEDLPANFDWKKPISGPPTLAIEIMSPNDSATQVLEKVRDYLDSGTSEVWVLYPDQQEVHQYRRTSPDVVRVYTQNEVIDTREILPELNIVVRDMFQLPSINT